MSSQSFGREAMMSILISVLPLGVSACCGDGPPEYQQDDRIDPNDPAISELVDSCLADDESCIDLCRKLVRPADGGMAIEAQFSECRLMDEAGTVLRMTYTMPYDCVAGRRPACMGAQLQEGRHRPVALWLAQMAHLEAAAVYAFARTAKELARHQVPEALIRRCLVAMSEEVQHTELMGQLALEAGIEPPITRVATETPMSLYELARDNLVEGCVRECLGALTMLYQSRQVRDPRLAEVFATIAEDELRHAALSFDIHRALLPRLSEAERQRLRVAKGLAIMDLLDEPAASMEPSLVEELGWPDCDSLRSMVRALESGPWRDLL